MCIAHGDSSTVKVVILARLHFGDSLVLDLTLLTIFIYYVFCKSAMSAFIKADTGAIQDVIKLLLFR